MNQKAHNKFIKITPEEIEHHMQRMAYLRLKQLKLNMFPIRFPTKAEKARVAKRKCLVKQIKKLISIKV